ncbi:MAG: Hypothetical protein C75L2_00460011 [Leptospirillum sp. Group II 'C75']|jgi:hypothetical protein|uniref:hypothetical protein n=1 Tax=Leptospirillum sp. Group II 'CF-1' TaxID=1660083 RepID=UPI0000F0C925|nr:hypothetical protein [Leptospirillum sp. Group II 'CF-1']EAY57101.1 MAG: hypothetical protein UBAL2_80490382 [Leptospirillum rubarum]EIJ76563.1 MAG: Hypothetical protein C75L2_00460011 [Leptospirillum sp. Group II 'C75']
MKKAFTNPTLKALGTFSIVILTLATLFIVFEKIDFRMVKGSGGFESVVVWSG